MQLKNPPREVKYPENLKINKQLKSGDRLLIAEKAGLSPGTVRDMLLGFRRITDKAGYAIIDVLEKRRQLQKSLEEIANQ